MLTSPIPIPSAELTTGCTSSRSSETGPRTPEVARRSPSALLACGRVRGNQGSEDRRGGIVRCHLRDREGARTPVAAPRRHRIRKTPTPPKIRPPSGASERPPAKFRPACLAGRVPPPDAADKHGRGGRPANLMRQATAHAHLGRKQPALPAPVGQAEDLPPCYRITPRIRTRSASIVRAFTASGAR